MQENSLTDKYKFVSEKYSEKIRFRPIYGFLLYDQFAVKNLFISINWNGRRLWKSWAVNSNYAVCKMGEKNEDPKKKKKKKLAPL